MTKLSIDTPIYNEKRYGVPYIGVLNNTTGKVDRWGLWIGTPGNRGLLELDVSEGDAIITGKKDIRGGKSYPSYGVISIVDGVPSITTMQKVDAIKASREKQKGLDDS